MLQAQNMFIFLRSCEACQIDGLTSWHFLVFLMETFKVQIHPLKPQLLNYKK